MAQRICQVGVSESGCEGQRGTAPSAVSWRLEESNARPSLEWNVRIEWSLDWRTLPSAASLLARNTPVGGPQLRRVPVWIQLEMLVDVGVLGLVVEELLHYSCARAGGFGVHDAREDQRLDHQLGAEVGRRLAASAP